MTTIIIPPKTRSSSSSRENPPTVVELERIARRAWETFWKAQAAAARDPSDPKLRKAKATALKIANAAEARAERADLELGPPAWGSPRDI